MTKVVIEGNREFEIYEITGVFTIYVKRKRPDLAWILERFKEISKIAQDTDYYEGIEYLDSRLKEYPITPGEAKNLLRYLEYLDLISGEKITKHGKNALKTGEVWIPEKGIYQLYYIIDDVVGNVLVHYKRITPQEKLSEIAEIKKFEAFELFDRREYKDLLRDRNEEFRIIFEKSEGQFPYVIYGEKRSGIIKLMYNQGESTWIAEGDINGKKFEIKGTLESFDVNKNMSKWVSNWNTKFECMEITFDEAKKISDKGVLSLENFEQTISFDSQQLWLKKNKKDKYEWNIRVKAPIIPKTEDDLNEWLSFLILRDLRKYVKYYTRKYLMNQISKYMKAQPAIVKKFTEYNFPLDEFIEQLRKENRKIYYRIKATEDLLIDASV